jgi:hypothetical protein
VSVSKVVNRSGPSDPAYESALDQAMQWLKHLILTTATYFAAALAIAAALFALLLHSSHQRHRQAH